MPVEIKKGGPSKGPYALKKERRKLEHAYCPSWVPGPVRDEIWEALEYLFSTAPDDDREDAYIKMIAPVTKMGPSDSAINWEKWWRGVDRGGRDVDDREQAPYMVTVSAGRVSASPGAVLFDSEVRHQHYIKLAISSAYRDRHLSTDWVHTDREIFEVVMTEAQWAAMISTLNHGSGTPATLSHILHQQPPIKPELPEDRTSLFKAEMGEALSDVVKRIEDLSEGRLTKAQQHELRVIRDFVKSNGKFVVDQFQEHMEKSKAKQKAEIEAAMNAAIARAGRETLFGPDTPGRIGQDDVIDATPEIETKSDGEGEF